MRLGSSSCCRPGLSLMRTHQEVEPIATVAAPTSDHHPSRRGWPWLAGGRKNVGAGTNRRLPHQICGRCRTGMPARSFESRSGRRELGGECDQLIRTVCRNKYIFYPCICVVIVSIAGRVIWGRVHPEKLHPCCASEGFRLSRFWRRRKMSQCVEHCSFDSSLLM